MRLLHTEASPGWGGQEIRILREAEGIRKRGHQVILAPQKAGGLARFAKEKGFQVYEIDYRKSRLFSCFYKLIHLLRKEKIDVLNTHSSLDAWLGGIAARVLSIPIVRTRHLSTSVKKGLNSILLYHYLTDFVVTTCSSIIPSLSQQSGKPINYFRSVPTGVDPEMVSFTKEEAFDFRRSLGLSSNEILVGTACFMRSWKGIEDFLQAASLLRAKPIKWVIIGGGHSEKYILKAKELNLQDFVFFTGHMENPFPAMAALDIFVLLSTRHEGVSQSCLQAAYLGKPLITTPTGGLAEVCIDQLTGLQVPIFSSKKVEEAVLFMMDRPELRAEWGAQAKKLVVEKFTLSSMLDQMESIFLSLRSCL